MNIAIAYFRDPLAPRTGMDLIRWYELAKGLNSLGHAVDMVSPVAVNSTLAPGLRTRNLQDVKNWHFYDVVKTRSQKDIFFIPEHPFIISRIGRVVDQEKPSHQWAIREERIKGQDVVHTRAKAVVFTCKENIPRWQEMYPVGPDLLVIPTGCPSDIPDRGENPYSNKRNVVFIGSLTSSRFVERLNKLGRALAAFEINLCFMGRNQLDTYRETDEEIDPKWVKHLGCVAEQDTWNYLLHADVGVTFARNKDVFDSDSSKIYYYLRAGLPTISEDYVASNYLLEETFYGAVAEYDDISDMVEKIRQWMGRKERGPEVQDHMTRYHSWSCRANSLHDYVMRAGKKGRA